jgi:hypothetical protein
LPEHVDSEWEPYISLALPVRDRLKDGKQVMIGEFLL